MKNFLNAVESQQIMIHIMTNTSQRENLWMKEKLKEQLNGKGIVDTDEKNSIEVFINLCMRTAHELRTTPEKYGSFDAVFRTIIARQKAKPVEKIKKKEYRDALGIKYNAILERILSGKSLLTMDKIDEICKGFEKEANRRFWKNQILILDPNIAYFEKDMSLEYKCLQQLCEMLSDEKFDYYKCKLNLTEQEHLLCIRKGVHTETDEETNTGNDSNTLYEYINAKARKIKIPIQNIVEEELGISINTWYARKNAWEEAERTNFQNGIPHIRIARTQLMVLSVIFGLDYPETILLLALAGYRLKNEEPDYTLVKYLRDKKRNLDSKEASVQMKEYLLDGMFKGKW